jgi:hypothetical protein
MWPSFVIRFPEDLLMKASLKLILAVLSCTLVIGSGIVLAADVAPRKDKFTPEARSYWAFQPVAATMRRSCSAPMT